MPIEIKTNEVERLESGAADHILLARFLKEFIVVGGLFANKDALREVLKLWREFYRMNSNEETRSLFKDLWIKNKEIVTDGGGISGFLSLATISEISSETDTESETTD